MILTEEKIKVTDKMLQENNMTRGDQFGIPVDPRNPSYGLHWKSLFEITEEDLDNLEEYFIYKLTQ